MILVLDALDECGEESRTPFLEKLVSFFQNPQPNDTVKCIITSRPYDLQDYSYCRSCPQLGSIQLTGEGESEMQQIEQEIALVIDQQLQDFNKLRQSHGIDDDALELLRTHLSNIENRTYLWIALTFPELKIHAKASISKLLEVVQKLPHSVQDAYEGILGEPPMKLQRERFSLFFCPHVGQ